VPNGTVIEYDFPAGLYTFVLRRIDVFLAGIGGGAVQAYDNYDSTFWSDTQPSPDDGFWFNWDGRQVFAPGDKLFLTADNLSSDTSDFRASGYALTGLAPFAPLT
jgi:hypothetical protein